jgi:hypothetical protein
MKILYFFPVLRILVIGVDPDPDIFVIVDASKKLIFNKIFLLITF